MKKLRKRNTKEILETRLRDLPQAFKKYGTDFAIVIASTFNIDKTCKAKAIYKEENKEHYEVHILVWVEKDSFVKAGPHWRTPGTSTWGTFGWTFRSFDAAIKKYDSI